MSGIFSHADLSIKHTFGVNECDFPKFKTQQLFFNSSRLRIFFFQLILGFFCFRRKVAFPTLKESTQHLPLTKK